jgi:hypothetical protein
MATKLVGVYGVDTGNPRGRSIPFGAFLRLVESLEGDPAVHGGAPGTRFSLTALVGKDASTARARAEKSETERKENVRKSMKEMTNRRSFLTGAKAKKTNNPPPAPALGSSHSIRSLSYDEAAARAAAASLPPRPKGLAAAGGDPRGELAKVGSAAVLRFLDADDYPDEGDDAALLLADREVCHDLECDTPRVEDLMAEPRSTTVVRSHQ